MNLNATLPFGVRALDALTLLVAVSAFAAVWFVWASGLVRDPMRGRVKQLQSRREALRTGYTQAKRRDPINRKAKSVGLMRQVVNRFNLLKNQQSRKVVEKLAEAGMRSKDAVVIYMFCRLVLPLALAAMAVILFYVFDWMSLSDTNKMMYSVGLVLAAMFGPELFVKNAISKRMDKIRKSLPDALDLLVICAEAGLTLDAALMRVARETGKSNPEIGDEFSLTAVELGFLPERRQALENLSKRVTLPACRAVVTTLMQTERYGTPLAQSLRVLSGEFRNERLMKAEEKAAKLPATLTVPLILFILPTLFVVLMTPAVISIKDNFIK